VIRRREGSYTVDLVLPITGANMATAIVLVKAERGTVNQVAQALVEVEGVTEVYSVGGRWDLVAVLRCKTHEALAQLVTERMQGVSGICDTETMIAFRTLSHHDLESMFSIGM
jgi:DNA-binding Lrp family transcriptional regulator